MSLETRYTLETPEQIEVEFEVAGPGSRFLALFVDVMMQWLIIFSVAIVLALTGFSLAPIFDGEFATQAGRFALTVMIIVAFFVLVGYYILCEMLMGGQTIGKRYCKIRVIRDDATPITFTASLIRNILRTVDVLPGFYGVGGLISLFHPAHKRLGDLAAGTMVVKEAEADFRGETDRKNKSWQPTEDPRVGNAELTPAEKQVLGSFLSRRSELMMEARRGLAERLAKPLYEKYGGDWDDAESYIERLLQGTHYGDVGPEAASVAEESILPASPPSEPEPLFSQQEDKNEA